MRTDRTDGAGFDKQIIAVISEFRRLIDAEYEAVLVGCLAFDYLICLGSLLADIPSPAS